jgi:hypothetical protein
MEGTSDLFGFNARRAVPAPATTPDPGDAPDPDTDIETPRGLTRAWRATRPYLAGALTVLAAALVFTALVLPDQSTRLGAATFLRLPVEALVLGRSR